MLTERRYDIDWLRVIAIGLLLIYHIAIVFQPWAMFIGFIRSEESMENLWLPMTMLNVWRIPFLFFVSGMGLYFAMKKRNIRQLLAERSLRILLPFVFGSLAITPLHMLVFQQYYHLPMSYFPHMGHLWFLGNIFAYVLLLSPIFHLLIKKEDSKFSKTVTSIMRHPLVPIAISAFFVLETFIVKPQIFSLYAETLHGFILGMLAFFFGFLAVYSGKEFWLTVRKWKWLYLGLAAVLFAIRLIFFQTTSPSYLMAIESNCWIFGVFGLGYQYLNKPGPALSYLSKAAYPVYIVHMFALFAGASIILPLELPVFVKFVFINIFTFLICFAIYELFIRRIGFIRPLFGLKWQAISGKRQKEDDGVKGMNPAE